MKSKKNILSTYLLLNSLVVFCQYIPTKRSNVPEKWYLEAVERLNKIYSAESYGRFAYLQKASAYANLSEPPDSVFKYLNLALVQDSQRTCKNLNAFEKIMPNSKNGMYFGYVDRLRYAKIQKECLPIIQLLQQSEKNKKNADLSNLLLDVDLVKILDQIFQDDQSYREELSQLSQCEPLDRLVSSHHCHNLYISCRRIL